MSGRSRRSPRRRGKSRGSSASKASAKNKTDNNAVDMSLQESPAVRNAAVNSPLPTSGTGSSNQEFHSFGKPNAPEGGQAPVPQNPLHEANANTMSQRFAASTPQLTQNPLIGEEAAKALAAVELGMAELSISKGGHPSSPKPHGTATSCVSVPVGGSRALRSRTRNLGDQDKENLLNANDSIPGVTAYRVKTVTSVQTGRKSTKYLNLVPDEKNQQEYVSKRAFLSRFGFNPETGELRDMRMVKRLLGIVPAWAEVLGVQATDRQEDHDETVKHHVQEDDGFENVAPGSADTRIAASQIGTEGQDALTDVQTHHKSVSEVDHLDNTLKQLEGKRPPRYSILRQQGHSVNTLIRHVVEWTTWCQNAQKLLKEDSFQGGEPVVNMLHFHNICEVYTDFLQGLLSLDLRIINEAEILKNIPGPKFEKDTYVKEFWNSGFKEQDKIARSIQKLEVCADLTWRFYVVTTWFLKTQLRLMKRDADFYLNPADVCKMIPILRLQRTKVHLARAQVFKDWDILFKGVHKTQSISLSNANDLISDILEQRDASLEKQVRRYLSRLETHIYPYIRLRLNHLVGSTLGSSYPVDTRQKFDELSNVPSSTYRVPLRKFPARPDTQNQTGNNDEVLRLLNDRPPPNQDQSTKKNPPSKLTTSRNDGQLLPPQLDSQQVAKTQTLVERNALSRNQPTMRRSGWRETGLTGLINQSLSAPRGRTIVPGQEQPPPPRDVKPPVSASTTGGSFPQPRHLGSHPEERSIIHLGNQKPEESDEIHDPWHLEYHINDQSPADDLNREEYRDSGSVHQGLQDYRGGKPGNFPNPYRTFSAGGSSSHRPKSTHRQGGDGRHPGRGPGGHPPPGGGGSGPPGGDPDPDDGSGNVFQSSRRNQDDPQGNITMQDLSRFFRQDRVDPDLLEGFTSRADQHQFYAGLPEPWNVQPRTEGKKEHIYRNVNAVFDDKSKSFKGKVNDGSYYIWRVDVIQCIHKAALPISEKILLLNKVVDRTQPVLQMLFMYNTFSPDTYRMLIETLEHDFGGELRIYTYFRNELLKGKKLDFDKRESVQIMRIKIQRYLDHLRVNNFEAVGDSNLILSVVLQTQMSDTEQKKFREDGINSGEREPNSLPYLVKWLFKREVVLKFREEQPFQAITDRGVKAKETQKTFFRKRQYANAYDAHEVDDPDADSTLDDGATSLEPSECHLTRPDKQMIKPQKKPPPKSGQDRRGNTLAIDEGTDIPDYEDALSDYESVDCYVGVDQDLWYLEPEELDVCLAANNFKMKVCSVCKEDRHVLHRCTVFKELPASKRLAIITRQKRCTNCLSPDHGPRNCKSQYNCSTCNKRHHSLLHMSFTDPKRDVKSS